MNMGVPLTHRPSSGDPSWVYIIARPTEQPSSHGRCTSGGKREPGRPETKAMPLPRAEKQGRRVDDGSRDRYCTRDSVTPVETAAAPAPLGGKKPRFVGEPIMPGEMRVARWCRAWLDAGRWSRRRAELVGTVLAGLWPSWSLEEAERSKGPRYVLYRWLIGTNTMDQPSYDTKKNMAQSLARYGFSAVSPSSWTVVLHGHNSVTFLF
jgi:hypothetical protein